MSERADVLVVGAGLSGLACALELRELGREPLVVEASERVGGRVATDEVDGFLLDRGFQVLNDAYPHVERLDVIEELDAGAFEPGALVRHGGRFHRVADPLRRPLDALASLLGPIGSLGDAIALARWRIETLRPRESPPDDATDETALERLRRRGVGESMIERFFRPFFGGVFLDPDLGTSARLLEELFATFAQGTARLPARGMRALPEALAARLPEGAVRCGVAVRSVTDEGDSATVEIDSGERLTARAVVVATDEDVARRLLGLDPSPHGWNAATSVSFAAESDPVGGRRLVLGAGDDGPVRNLCVPSAVSPSYAPPGAHLVTAAIPGLPDGTDDELIVAVRGQLRGWFGAAVDGWRTLRVERVPHALPRRPPGSLTPWRRPVAFGARLFACGDWLDQPSIDGAIASGARAARAVAEAPSA